MPARHWLACTAATALLLRYAPASILGLLPPCPIHQAFGILCPGCGGTRALLALLHGDSTTAWQLNPLLVLSLPLLAAFLALKTLQPHRRLPHLPTRLTTCLLLGVLGFTIARNL